MFIGSVMKLSESGDYVISLTNLIDREWFRENMKNCYYITCSIFDAYTGKTTILKNVQVQSIRYCDIFVR